MALRLTFFVVLSIAAAAPRSAAPVTLPLTFELNVGQTDPQVKFLAHGPRSALWLTAQGPVLSLGDAVFRMRFQGGARAPEVEAEDPRDGVSNYLSGSDPAKWKIGVRHFGKVRYRGVYPGIDVVFYGNPQSIEYDFVVAPGADPARIRVVFEGIERLRVDPSSGDLVLKTRRGEIRNRRPAIYQNGKPVNGHYVLRGRRSAGFAVDVYDKSLALVIDPVLTYGSMLGGTGINQAYGVAMDGQGMIYLGGETTSSSFPLRNALFSSGVNEGAFGGGVTSAFVAKFNPSASGGTSLVYSTYIGGNLPAGINAIASDAAGNVVVTGYTDSGPSDGFPLKNAFQSTFNDSMSCGGSAGGPTGAHCNSAFVLKLNPSGSALVYSSYLSGGNGDTGTGVAIDSAGNAYVAGYTDSLSFPVQGINGQPPFQSNLRQNENGFLTMVGTSGSLLYSTYFGGGQNTRIESVAVDSAGLIYVGGLTNYTGMPVTPGAFQSKLVGLESAFAAIFNLSPNANSQIQYCTYLGGAQSPDGNGGSQTGAFAVATDNKGNVYLGGTTNSAVFPTSANAFFTGTRGNNGLYNPLYGDAFITMLNPSAQGSAQLVYSTFWGGSGDDVVNAMAVDSSGRITVAGTTNSRDFPVGIDALEYFYDGLIAQNFQATFGFITRFDPSQSPAGAVLYSTYLGGTRNSYLTALAQDPAGKTLAVAGYSVGTAPVTASAAQPAAAGQQDTFVARFDMTTEGPLVFTMLNSGTLHQGGGLFLSPGLLFTLEGLFPGPSTPSYLQLDANGFVSTTNAGVQVLVNGIPAPLIYVSSTVINAVAPYELASLVGQAVRVQVVYNGVVGNVFPVGVAATAPGILNYDDGSGQAVIGNQGYSANGPQNPAAIGSVITIYATGEGQTNPPGVNGKPANDFNNLPAPVAPVTVTIGGVPAHIEYAGAAPTAVAGLFQVNVTIPPAVTPGPALPIVLTVGGVKSQTTATMAVKAQ